MRLCSPLETTGHPCFTIDCKLTTMFCIFYNNYILHAFQWKVGDELMLVHCKISMNPVCLEYANEEEVGMQFDNV